MSSGLYILVRCALLFIDIITLALTVRMIMSWIMTESESKLGTFLYVVTEPIIMPIRALCDRFGWFRGMPVDMPFFITALLLLILRVFLEGSIGF